MEGPVWPVPPSADRGVTGAASRLLFANRAKGGAIRPAASGGLRRRDSPGRLRGLRGWEETRPLLRRVDK